jgi:hypothetical protein
MGTYPFPTKLKNGKPHQEQSQAAGQLATPIAWEFYLKG